MFITEVYIKHQIAMHYKLWILSSEIHIETQACIIQRAWLHHKMSDLRHQRCKEIDFWESYFLFGRHTDCCFGMTTLYTYNGNQLYHIPPAHHASYICVSVWAWWHTNISIYEYPFFFFVVSIIPTDGLVLCRHHDDQVWLQYMVHCFLLFT